MRVIEGKTALNRATGKGYTAIRQLLKDRAEGRKLVSIISHTEINTVSESGNVEWLKGKMNEERLLIQLQTQMTLIVQVCSKLQRKVQWSSSRTLAVPYTQQQ